MENSLKMFLKTNKRAKENTTFAATKSLLDEKGNPLKWEIKSITTKENDAIRDSCMIEIPIKGKVGLYREKLNTSKYMAKLGAACVVSPNLFDADLQDSYGVKTPEDLIIEMIDDPNEFNDFILFIQEYNGFTETISEKVDNAKN